MIGSTLFGIGRTTAFAESAMDSDAIAAELANVQECAGDPFEFATAIMYENELAMMKLDAAIMCCEYAYLKENGEEMVYEAGAMKNFFEGAKKALQKFWEKLKAFFKKIFNWLQDVVKNDKKFVEKYKKDCQEAGTVKVDVKGYDFKGVNKLMDSIDELSSVDVGNMADSIEGKEINVSETVDDVADKVIKALGGNGATRDNFAEQLKDTLKGSEVKGSVDCPAQIKYIEDAKKDRATLEAAYKASDATLKFMKKQIEISEKYVNKTEEKEAAKKASQGAHAAVQVINQLCSMLSAINNKGASAIKARRNQARKFVIAALAEYKKNKDKKDSANESSLYDDIFDSILG